LQGCKIDRRWIFTNLSLLLSTGSCCHIDMDIMKMFIFTNLNLKLTIKIGSISATKNRNGIWDQYATKKQEKERWQTRNRWLIKIAHTVSELGKTFGNWFKKSSKRLVEAVNCLVIRLCFCWLYFCTVW
jgi:hypothetical protein